MRSATSSMLIGAAVAAFLILPASGADTSWITWPTKSFNTSSLRVDDMVGNIRVNVQPGPMKVDVAGNKDLISGLTVMQDGNQLRISGSDFAGVSVWDWKKWFDFSHIHDERHGKLFVKVTVPKGTEVRIDDLVGDATIGDTFGKLHLETTAGDASVGRVAEARIGVAGSGKVAIADVAGDLRLEIAGSGSVSASHAGSVRAEIAGSGDANIGTITGGARVDIAGSGNFTAKSVNGPVKVDIAGSGNVKIADGVADPLRVDIIGAGDLNFGGVAVDPRITALGSGTVRIRAYRGRLSNDGMATVQVGATPPIPPRPPMAHIPPIPPVPPVPPVGRHHHDDDDDN